MCICVYVYMCNEKASDDERKNINFFGIHIKYIYSKN